MDMQDQKIINECYAKSVELLKNNSTPFGILASSVSKRAVDRNYLSIFGRDAAICALGMMASGDEKLISIARKSLDTLARFQAPNGQIPNSVKPEAGTSSFWTLGCIDATLWWLIAMDRCKKCSGKKINKSFENKIKLSLNWLLCQEHQQDGLIMQNEASDMADLMPRSGKVLYANALWYLVKKLYQIKDLEKTKENFNLLFYPFDKKIKELRFRKKTIDLILKDEKPENFYLSFVNYMYWGNDIDVFANSLSVLLGLATEKFSKKIVAKISAEKRSKNLPMPILLRPIEKNSKLWRTYMENYNQNIPFQYQNGGIWPFVSCFWAMALYVSGQEKAAWEEMKKIAEINQINHWEFNEWFHGKTGKPMGMTGQSWNAGAFLLAYHCLKGETNICII
jgi:glycogen debranching enzyme